MFELKVTIGLNPETMAIIKLLVSPQTIAFKDVTEPEAPKVEKPRGVKAQGFYPAVTKAREDNKPEPIVNGHTEKQPEDKSPIAVEVLTIEEVRAKIAAKKQELNDAEPIKKLLQSFGVSKATDLPSDAYLPFITQLETLKAA